MFFFFSKLLFFFLSPLVWVFALLILALIYRKKKKSLRFLIAGIVVLYFFSNSFIRKEAYRIWEYPFTNPEGTYDYAIVLGGFSGYDYNASRLIFTYSGDRFFQAYQLYQQGKVKKLFISGGSGSVTHPDWTEADKVKEFALSLKIPEQDIIMEKESRNTHENAVNTANWLTKNDPSAKCLLVTSAGHMRRALGCYKKVGLDVVPYTTDRLTRPRDFDPENLFVPDPESISIWISLLKEMTGVVVYRIAGYI